MNLSKNLYFLRKRDKITQEELAERLGVSRQSVSKWETGEASPETEKLVALCDLFKVTLDELVRNDLTADKHPDDAQEQTKTCRADVYISHMNAFSVKISVGVFLILFGVACCVMIAALSAKSQNAELLSTIGAAVLLFFIAIAVFLFVSSGLSHDKFRKEYPTVQNIFTQTQIDSFVKRFTIAMACLVSAILVDVVLLVLMTAFIENELFAVPDKEQALVLCAAAFLFLLSMIVGGLVYFGIQHTKFHVSEYNGENNRSQSVDGICGAIMMSAAAVYLIIGFIWNLWHPGWVVFPVGGIICGIVSTIFKKKS